MLTGPSVKKVLTVEDNEQVREILAPMLEMWSEEQGFELVLAEMTNGAEALAWVKANGRPDMVLLDVRMSVMDGAEFLRQSAMLGIDLRPQPLC